MNISVHAEADLTAVAHNDLANAVRFLAVDAIETSQSGHPGLPMGMADVGARAGGNGRKCGHSVRLFRSISCRISGVRMSCIARSSLAP